MEDCVCITSSISSLSDETGCECSGLEECAVNVAEVGVDWVVVGGGDCEDDCEGVSGVGMAVAKPSDAASRLAAVGRCPRRTSAACAAAAVRSGRSGCSFQRDLKRRGCREIACKCRGTAHTQGHSQNYLQELMSGNKKSPPHCTHKLANFDSDSPWTAEGLSNPVGSVY